MKLIPLWKTQRAIDFARKAVEALYRDGGMTREERAIAIGNLAEAEAKLKLAAAGRLIP